MIGLKLTALLLLTVTPISGTWETFLETPFAVEHTPHSWTFHNMSTKCIQYYVDDGGFAKKFSGDACESTDKRHSHIAIVKWFCIMECYIPTMNEFEDQITCIDSVDNNDYSDPSNVHVQCLCNGSRKSESINMRDLHYKWSNTCTDTPIATTTAATPPSTPPTTTPSTPPTTTPSTPPTTTPSTPPTTTPSTPPPTPPTTTPSTTPTSSINPNLAIQSECAGEVGCACNPNNIAAKLNQLAPEHQPIHVLPPIGGIDDGRDYMILCGRENARHIFVKCIKGRLDLEPRSGCAYQDISSCGVTCPCKIETLRENVDNMPIDQRPVLSTSLQTVSHSSTLNMTCANSNSESLEATCTNSIWSIFPQWCSTPPTPTLSPYCVDCPCTEEEFSTQLSAIPLDGQPVNMAPSALRNGQMWHLICPGSKEPLQLYAKCKDGKVEIEPVRC